MKKIKFLFLFVLSLFLVITNCDCDGNKHSGGGPGPGPGPSTGPDNNPPKVEAPKKSCTEQGLSTDSTGACFKPEFVANDIEALADYLMNTKHIDANPTADLSKIDVSKVKEMTCLFSNNTANCGSNANIVNKKLAAVLTHAGKNFVNFNGDISKWNTSSVEKMDYMFNFNTSFNGDIGKWNTSKVTTLKSMFDGATAFNQNVGDWNTSNVTDMNTVFRNASKFNQDLSKWSVKNVINIAGMFWGATAMSYNLEAWKVDPTPQRANHQTGVYKANVFKNTAVAAANKYPSWCTHNGYTTNGNTNAACY